MNHIIRYRSFGSPDVLEEADVPLSEPQGADVRVRVHAVGLNPVDYKTFNGDLRALEHLRQLAHPLRRTPMFPRGVGRDFSGVITAVGPSVTGYSVGDPVLGTLRSTPGQIAPPGDAGHGSHRADGDDYGETRGDEPSGSRVAGCRRRNGLRGLPSTGSRRGRRHRHKRCGRRRRIPGFATGTRHGGHSHRHRGTGERRLPALPRGHPCGVRTGPGDAHRSGQPRTRHKTPRLLRKGIRAARSGPAHPPERQGHSGPVTRRTGPGSAVHWGAARTAGRPGESRPTGGVGANHDSRGQRVPHDPGRGPGGVHGARRRPHAWENRCHG